MGRFRKWISILAQATEQPVFVRMHETRVATPVDPRVFYPWAVSQEKPLNYKLMGLFRAFIMSETYSLAVAAEGAQYHDLEGNVTRAVPEASVNSARVNLSNIAEMRAAQSRKVAPSKARGTLTLKRQGAR